MSKSTIIVDLEYHLSLQEDSRKLGALMDAGVECWDGYELAMGGLDDEEKREDE